MEDFDEISSKNKILRKLPKKWNNEGKFYHDQTYIEREFSLYAKKLYESLLGIKKYYQEEFDKDNVYKIDEYIDLFNSVYNKYFHACIDDIQNFNEYYSSCENSNKNFDDNARFMYFIDCEGRSEKVFTFDKNNMTNGFTK